jgi:methylated-DNA-[protein]-cysteine S-methyltransferase
VTGFAQLSFLTPYGDFTLTDEDGAIVAADWGRGPAEHQRATPTLERAWAWLDGYFLGSRAAVEVDLAPRGTPKQRALWSALCRIPYGTIRTYGDLAAELGSSARAIGMACGANPLPLLIPCHRVLAAAGRLGGYSGDGGIDTKVRLLRLEGALL